MSKNDGIFEQFQVLGCQPEMGTQSAATLKSIESWLTIGSSVRSFRVAYSMRTTGDDYPWKLSVRRPMGADGWGETWEQVDEFRSLREARAEAYRFARDSAIKGPRAA